MTTGAADKAHDRADIDDRATAGLRHLLSGELGAEKDAGLVDRDDALPAFKPIRIADRAAGNPGFVAENIGDHDLGPFGREEPRLRLAHAVRAASDNRDFAVEPHGSLLASP